ALTPVTISNCGRSPRAVQPVSRPAPKAPSVPPPESARTSTTGRPSVRLAVCTRGTCLNILSRRASLGASSPQTRTPAMLKGSALTERAAVGTGLRGSSVAHPARHRAASSTRQLLNTDATPPRSRLSPPEGGGARPFSLLGPQSAGQEQPPEC